MYWMSPRKHNDNIQKHIRMKDVQRQNENANKYPEDVNAKNATTWQVKAVLAKSVMKELVT